MNDRDRLVELLRERSLEFGDFVLASGARSDFYIDVRRTTMHAEGQALVGRLGLAAIRAAGLAPQSVGGLTMGADPVSYAIAHASWLAGDPVNAFSVRKQAKGHGKGRRIEGTFEAGQKVVVIEDTITSGGSALEACAAVREEGGVVLSVLAVVDRESGGREAIEATGVPLITLVGIRELLKR
ncbi:MAG: orotate phosphoribosyltransferase [Gemmatimonadota bacterium]|jgi:orotate phosphoribosyltransferase|nr:orotate phosphoribosyltransferase [Gemmatimonadota bacterium]